MSKKIITMILVSHILAIGVGVYGGMKYAQGHPPTGGPTGQFSRADLQNLSPEKRAQRLQALGAPLRQGFEGQANAGAGFRSGQRGGGIATGEIIAKDDTSVTIKLQDGGSKIVFLSGSTVISKPIIGTMDDLAIGTNVAANGTANADGSITAQMIQVRPANRQAPQN